MTQAPIAPNDRLSKLILQRARREKLDSRIKDIAFPKQEAILLDTATLKAAKCSRRAGKSNAAALDIAQEQKDYPGANFLYLGLTGDSAAAVIWHDCLQPLLKKLRIDYSVNLTKRMVTFTKSGSRLYWAGVDCTKTEMEKLLGRKYRKVYIDEGQSITINLEKLVYENLLPAITDYNGQIWLLGVPNNNTKSFYFKVTTGKIPGWSVHSWSALDNPHMREKWLARMESTKKAYPGIEDTPSFKNMFHGVWVIDPSLLIYKYDDARNGIDALPAGDARWLYELGVDLGHSPDPSAFVVSGYREHDPTLYFIHSFKKTHMDVTDVATVIKHYRDRWKFRSIVIDNANKQAVEEMKNRHRLPLEAASKQGKMDFINLMNGDFQTSRIKAVRTTCAELIDEWSTLSRDDREWELGKLVEDPSMPNHCADGALYNWRKARNFINRPAVQQEVLTPEEEINRYWQRKAQALKRDAERPFWERMAA